MKHPEVVKQRDNNFSKFILPPLRKEKYIKFGSVVYLAAIPEINVSYRVNSLLGSMA
jgi:hypothetical protein